MTPDRKLVEEIGRRICPHGDAYNAGPCEDCAEGVAHMVEVLRLVQLPEEPSGWVDMEDDILLWGYTGPNDGMTPFYTPNGGIDDADCILLDFGIPGDPQKVDDG